MPETTTAPFSEREVQGSPAEIGALYLALRADSPRSPPLRVPLREGSSLVVGRAPVGATEAELRGEGEGLSLLLPDRAVSSRHARLYRSDGAWCVEDLGSRNGLSVDGKATRSGRLLDGALLEIGHAFFEFRVERDAPMPPEPRRRPPGLRSILPDRLRCFRELEAIAGSGLCVLVRGETGSGKELAARAVHELSGRKGTFVAVNCGALSRGVLEAQLFGHVRGAFSGATEARAGLVRAAEGGTLFLDEIAELPADAQAALLRVLQEREVLPVGATSPVRVDFRLVAATHRDLTAAVEWGAFRGDLLARISGFEFELSPLRERRPDMGLIVADLLERHVPGEAVTLSRGAARRLMMHPWPRNVRELELALVRAIKLAEGRLVSEDDLQLVRVETSRPPPEVPSAEGARVDEAGMTREALVALLTEHHGNVSAVARALGKERAQVHRWIRRYGVDVWRLRGPSGRGE